MKKSFLFCTLLWLSVWNVAAQGSETLLRQFQSNLASLGRYRVEFKVEVEGYSAEGEYIVEGRDFYMLSDSVALYVAQGIKHEVNMRKREVVVDTTANLGSDLISNPVDAFAALERDFDVTTVADANVAVELRERGKNGGDTIRVEADASGRLPHRIIYSSVGSRLVIELRSIKAYAEPLPRFTEDLYSGYDVVDFR